MSPEDGSVPGCGPQVPLRFLSPEVRPTDFTSFLAVGVVLVLVSLAGAIAPVLRALRVDPAVARRHE